MKRRVLHVQGSAWRFVVLLGVVSLFVDMTYEGARSISGLFPVLPGLAIRLWG